MNWNFQVDPHDEEIRALQKQLSNHNIAKAHADEGQGLAIFLGWLILSEPLSAQMLIAAAIIVVAVMLIITRKPAVSRFKARPSQTKALPSNSNQHDTDHCRIDEEQG